MLVQELAAKVQQPPSMYVQPEQYHPVSVDVGAETPEPIPVIDLSRLSAADADDESGKLRQALQSWGLFLVSEHLSSCSCPSCMLVLLFFIKYLLLCEM